MMAKTEGFIIRTTDYGESNKIVTLYTKEFGKIGLMARGAKKPKNPLSAVSHVLFYGLCLFSKGRGLGTLYQAETLNAFRTVREDIEKMGYAALVLELTDRLTEERQPSESIYHLLQAILLLMDKGKDPAVLAALFAIKMMPQAGVAPELTHCVHCGQKRDNYAFSIMNGGFLCQNCIHTDAYAIHLSPVVQKLLPLIQSVPMERVGRINLKAKTIGEIESIIYAYYEQNAGIKLRSRHFLEQLSKFRTE
ncbi:DNA repair protein RecO [Sporolactobacillus kofuensis]|uniref:DNA repair protein RecO n=1 Tax=Sporolactobacillus kofuensis TaxID=269672 RepID=A0ABW1WCJ0_9BACL|nr:DNA repair protein RecO [Sporolactobacillus kofuensis]MCO7175691.1 DNA repair protein RecO [Sporolactobacillus kofuensis]